MTTKLLELGSDVSTKGWFQFFEEMFFGSPLELVAQLQQRYGPNKKLKELKDILSKNDRERLMKQRAAGILQSIQISFN
jgi:hypothetical protein